MEMLEKRRVAVRVKRHLKYVEVVPIEDATGLVACVYSQIARDMQIRPAAVLHSAAPQLLAGAWCILRETLLVGKAPRLIKEAVGIGVSHANECTWHGREHLLNLPERLAQLVDLLPDFAVEDLLAIAQWANRSAGKDVHACLQRLSSGLGISEILGTAVAFHYFNRMVNVFLAPVRCTEGVLGYLGPSMENRLPSAGAGPGDSLSLLPPAALPEDLRWAQSNPVVAGAFARMARVVESNARELIPEEVRAVVGNRIARWNGEASRADLVWIENAIRVLHTMDRPLATLLLLTAFGSHQVDARLVAAVRKGCPDPHEWSRYLVSVVSWAAFKAARRVGTWLECYCEIAGT